MGVVTKLKELEKVKLTLNTAPTPATKATPVASPVSTPGLTAEQLIEALETAQRRGLH